MTDLELKAIKDKVAADAKVAFEKQNSELQSQVEEKVNAAFEKLTKGTITKEVCQQIVADATKEYGEKATKLEGILREQGDKLNGLVEKIKAPTESMYDIGDLLKPYIPQLKEIYRAGSGFITIDAKSKKDAAGAELKHPEWAAAQHASQQTSRRKAAETSVANSILTMTPSLASPYAPGIDLTPLTIYEIARNPIFVSSYTDIGTTDLSRLAWINETQLLGLPTIVTEGAQKPLTQRTFTVQYSIAKKIAAYIGITEEFDQDLPYLSTAVRRLLQMDIVRAWDLQVQADVQANATQLNFTTALGPNAQTIAPLKASIFDATYYDALFTMGTAVRMGNFIPNVSLVHPITMTKMLTTKDAYGRYNVPPEDLMRQINPMQGNNLSPDYALVGDLKQFKVDIYEDFSLKIGWINDDMIRNQFTVVAEVRFHDYISTNRTGAIMYADAKYLAEQLNGSSDVIVGS
jgi:hypothetical protein